MRRKTDGGFARLAIAPVRLAIAPVRRKVNWRFVGFSMVAAGTAIMIWRNIHEPDLMGIGRVLVIVGALVAVFAKLNAKTERSTEDFNEGYDKGMDAGYRMAQEEGVKAKPERPKLVDMADHIERGRNSASVGSSLRRTSRRGDEE